MNELSLRVLMDESALRAQLGRVARLLDGKRWADLSSVFSEDVQFDYGDGNGSQYGLPLLTQTFTRHLDQCGPTQHLLGSVIVTVDGDTASTETYVQARHAGRDDRSGSTFDTNGEYLDSWSRLDDRWLIVQRKVRWITVAGDPAVLGL